MDVTSIDAVDASLLRSDYEIAAICLRKLQLLYCIAEEGVKTRNDIVVGLCQWLNVLLAQLISGIPPSDPSYVKLEDLLMSIISCGHAVGTMFPLGDIEEMQ